MKKHLILLLALAAPALIKGAVDSQTIQTERARKEAQASAALNRIKYIKAARDGDVAQRVKALQGSPELVDDVDVYIVEYESGKREVILAQVQEDKEVMDIGASSARSRMTWTKWMNQEWKPLAVTAVACLAVGFLGGNYLACVADAKSGE